MPDPDVGALALVAGEDAGLPAPLNVGALLDKAVSAGLTPEALEKLVGLQERILDREAAAAFGRALADFQAECGPIQKNRTVRVKSRNTGQVYEYDYAELDTIAEAIRPLLHKHGLSYSFDMTFADGRVVTVCIVRHRDGHSERTTFSAPVDHKAIGMNDTQKVASATTYARRQALTLALGLTISGDPSKASGGQREDDDGMAAGSNFVTDQQAAELETALTRAGGNRDRFLAYMKVEAISDIPAAAFDRAMRTIAQVKQARQAADQRPMDQGDRR